MTQLEVVALVIIMVIVMILPCSYDMDTHFISLPFLLRFTGLSYLIVPSDSLSLGLSSFSILSLPPHPAHLVPYQMTCLSGLVTFYVILQCSITITGTTSISGTTTGTLSISGFLLQLLVVFAWLIVLFKLYQ
jgi:hypothetical protein